jgi:hypothetical protein
MAERGWIDVAGPLGGTVFGLIVVPSAMAQYPDFFSHNRWLLPVSSVVTLCCWAIPLARHHRTRRIYSRIIAIPKVVGLLFALLCLLLRLFCLEVDLCLGFI